MVGNAAANQLQLAHPGRKQRGGRVLVLGLNGIWHLSPKSDRQNAGQLHSFNSWHSSTSGKMSTVCIWPVCPNWKKPETIGDGQLTHFYLRQDNSCKIYPWVNIQLFKLGMRRVNPFDKWRPCSYHSQIPPMPTLPLEPLICQTHHNGTLKGQAALEYETGIFPRVIYPWVTEKVCQALADHHEVGLCDRTNISWNERKMSNLDTLFSSWEL